MNPVQRLAQDIAAVDPCILCCVPQAATASALHQALVMVEIGRTAPTLEAFLLDLKQQLREAHIRWLDGQEQSYPHGGTGGPSPPVNGPPVDP